MWFCIPPQPRKNLPSIMPYTAILEKRFIPRNMPIWCLTVIPSRFYITEALSGSHLFKAMAKLSQNFTLYPPYFNIKKYIRKEFKIWLVQIISPLESAKKPDLKMSILNLFEFPHFFDNWFHQKIRNAKSHAPWKKTLLWKSPLTGYLET